MNLRLRPLGDQVIVITGASSGIGLATAEAAARAGAKLVLASACRREAEEVEESRHDGQVNTALAKFVPSVGDWIAAKQVDRQHYHEPPRNPNEALTHPSETMGVVGTTHGAGGRSP